jgi:hypothetical protein
MFSFMRNIMKFCEMTETDKQCYMVNCLADIRDAIKAAGGNIDDTTPYHEYASKIAGATNIESLEITPSTSSQEITASGNVDGFSPITVSAVTASIDEDIQEGNIKSGVEILGVTGTLVELDGETKTVIPQIYDQTIYPTNPKNAITEISVNAVTSNIDANIIPENIKSGVTILGVEGTYSGE